jgi:hypothetical protein
MSELKDNGMEKVNSNTIRRARRYAENLKKELVNPSNEVGGLGR